MNDGSLDSKKMFLNRVTNRKLKMSDTFTKIIPSYNHGEPTVLCETKTHATYKYSNKD